MTATIKVDGNDLWAFLRVADGDGFDPMDSNFLSPQFGDVVGEGAPLINMNEDNFEFVIPVHFNPAKDATFPNTKDGLHLLVQEWNKRLASAKTLEWADEGATSSTFRDIIAAKFEPSYVFRRAQAKWQSGVVRIWTRPYGHTGTYVLRATAAATGVGVGVSIPSIAGDRPAQLKVLVRTGSSAATDGRIVGIAPVPSGVVWDFSAASILTFNAAASNVLVGASGAAGSQYVGVWPVIDSQNLGRIVLSPASAYIGRQRILAVHAGGSGDQVWAEDHYGNKIAPPFNGTAVSGLEWGLIDLGVVDVRPAPGQATYGILIRGDIIPPNGYSYPPYPVGNSGNVQISRVFVLPDDSLSIAVDTNRRLLSVDDFYQYRAATPIASQTALSVDEVGNSYSVAGQIGTHALGYIGNGPNDYRGLSPASRTAAGLNTAHALVRVPTSADMVQSMYYLQRPTSASAAYFLGRLVSQGGNTATPFDLRLQSKNMGGSTAGTWALIITADGVLVASKGLLGISNYGELRLSTRGPAIWGELWDVQSVPSLVATISGSAAIAQYAGQPYFGLSIASMNPTSSLKDIFAHRVYTMPSVPLAPRDAYEFTPSGVIRQTAASAFSGFVDGVIGKTPPVASPGYQQVAAFEQPLSMSPANHLISVEVSVRERFTYSR